MKRTVTLNTLHNRCPSSRTLCFLRFKSLIQYIHRSDNVYILRLTTLLLSDKPQTHLSVPWLMHIPLHGMKRKFWLLNKFVNLKCFKFFVFWRNYWARLYYSVPNSQPSYLLVMSMRRREWNGNRRPGSSYHYLRMDRELFELLESQATPYMYMQKQEKQAQSSFYPTGRNNTLFCNRTHILRTTLRIQNRLVEAAYLIAHLYIFISVYNDGNNW